MKKRIGFRKLGMDGEHRWAMLRNMVTSLIHHERIMTTTCRAKELRRVAEQMVTHAKEGSLHHRRLAGAVVREQSAVVKLFEILGPRYKERCGGYTRIMKLAKQRRGDSADMSYIEFVDRDGELRKAKPAAPMGAPASIASLIYGTASDPKIV
jgi:large subunit ribosomal protein L17